MKAAALAMTALLALAVPAAAQPTLIFAKDARAHIGQAATVRGLVSGVEIRQGSGLIYLDGTFPYNGLTVVIPPSAIGSIDALEPYQDKLLDVVGVIQQIGTIPQMLVTSPNQIKVLDDDQAKDRKKLLLQ